MKLLARLVRDYLKPSWRGLVVRILIAMAVSASPYAFSLLGRWLVDDVLQVTGPPKVTAESSPDQQAAAAAWQPREQDEKLRLLLVFFGVSIGIHVAVTGLSAASELVNSRMNERLTLQLRSTVHEKLIGMEMKLFGREQVGQLMSRTMDDTAAIPANLTNLVVNTITQVAMLALGLVLLVRLNASMTWYVLGTLPFYAASCVVFLPRLRRNTEHVRQRVSFLTGYLIERLAGVSTIKNYAQEGREIERFGDEVEQNLHAGRRNHRLSLYFGTCTTLVTGLGTLVVLAVGFGNIRSGAMQLGEVLAFYQVTAQLFVPIAALVGMTTVAGTVQVLARRVYDILDTPDVMTGGGGQPVEIERIDGHVRFENVSLQYTEGGPFACRAVDLDVPAGRTVCLVGPTGCGKSTLIALLTRLVDPTEGRVMLDEVDLRRLRLRRLRRAVGNILHEVDVFTGTLEENLRFGAPQATPQQVDDAVARAGLGPLLARLPEGLATPVRPGDERLDTETLVRLAVARVLVTRPAIVTIDDTFSQVPEEVEVELLGAIEAELGDRTMLVAASRLSLCPRADHVVVMQRGQVAEEGTHEQLVSRPGIYRRMHMRHMGFEHGSGAGT